MGRAPRPGGGPLAWAEAAQVSAVMSAMNRADREDSGRFDDDGSVSERRIEPSEEGLRPQTSGPENASFHRRGPKRRGRSGQNQPVKADFARRFKVLEPAQGPNPQRSRRELTLGRFGDGRDALFDL